MEFVRAIRGCDHLWALKYPEKDIDELTLLFRNWSDFNFLLDFFMDNRDVPRKTLTTPSVLWA